MGQDKVESIVQFSPWLRDRCRKSKRPFIQDSEKTIQNFFQLDHAMPDRYRWRFTTVETFATIMSKNTNAKDFDRDYWVDMASNCQAFSVMTYWRASELLRPGIRCLNLKELVPAAVLARSLMELAASFILSANIIEKTIKNYHPKPNQITASAQLESLLLKNIWGTRLGNPEEHLQQTNIITILKKISKGPQGTDVYPTYEYLSEVAHPNIIGNARFWSHVECVNDDGSEVRVMERRAASIDPACK